MDLRPPELVLRCYAEQVDDQWQAFCLALTLAAQADSFAEARDKLHAMIVDYVEDALAGVDQAHSERLLRRKAPLRFRLKYQAYVLLQHFGMLAAGLRRLFVETLPLAPMDRKIGHV